MILIFICSCFILIGLFVLFLKHNEEQDEIEQNYKYRLRCICPCYRMSKRKFFPNMYIYYGIFVFIYSVLHANYAYDIWHVIYAILSFSIMVIGVFLK